MPVYSIQLPHLREWRLKRVLSQVMLADAALVNKATVLHLENGHYGAKAGTIRLLATALEITPEQLVEEAPKRRT